MQWFLRPLMDIYPYTDFNQKVNQYYGNDVLDIGEYKVPYNLIFFPTPFLIFLIFFPTISVLFPSSPLDNLPYSLNIIEQMILLPLTPFFHVIFSPEALKFPSPIHSLIFFPKGIDKLPPRREEFYTPLLRQPKPII